MSEEAKKDKNNKKINRMTLDEINKAIDETQKKQGNLSSKYAIELLRRKDLLSKKK